MAGGRAATTTSGARRSSGLGHPEAELQTSSPPPARRGFMPLALGGMVGGLAAGRPLALPVIPVAYGLAS